MSNVESARLKSLAEDAKEAAKNGDKAKVAQDEAEAKNWETGGKYDLAAKAAIGVLSGSPTGAGMLVAGASPYVSHAIGEATQGDTAGDKAANILLHTAWGAVSGQAETGNALAGALGEGGSAAAAQAIQSQMYPGIPKDQLTEKQKQNISTVVQAVTGAIGAAAGALGGGDAVDVLASAGQAQASGKNEVENNFLSDHSKAVLNDSRKKVHSHNGTPKDDQIVISKSYEDQRSDELAAKNRNGTATPEEEQELNGYLKEYVSEQLQSEKYTPDQVIQQVDDILSGTPAIQSSNDVPYYPYALSEEDKDQASDAIKNAEIWDTDASLPSKILTRLPWSRPQSFNEQAYHDAQGGLERYDAQQSQANIGTPAIYFLGGGVGTAVRAIAAGLSGYQYGTGANQILNGDTANGLLNTTLGGLGMIGAAGGEGLVNGLSNDVPLTGSQYSQIGAVGDVSKILGTANKVDDVNYVKSPVLADSPYSPVNVEARNATWEASYNPDNATSVGKNSSLPTSTPTQITLNDGSSAIYESNPKHTLGQSSNRQNAGIEPSNSMELFKNSVEYTNPLTGRVTRYAVDSNGNINRFFYEGKGSNSWHWAGATGQTKANSLDPNTIPISIKRQFGFSMK